MPFGNPFPSANDRQVANHLLEILAAQKLGTPALHISDPETMKLVEITLTPALSYLFLKMLRHIGSGDALTIAPIQRMLTTQQAADLLGVSRPHLIKLLDAGEITFTTVGRHRRIKAKDVFAYKVVRDQARSDALAELIANDAELY